MNDIIPIENITGLIYLIRGKKVILDRDLAVLYGVETKRLKEQVKRNIGRFPERYMFQLWICRQNDVHHQHGANPHQAMKQVLRRSRHPR